MSVQILKPQFASLFVVVEIAWGANLTLPMSGWTWTDITSDVFMSGTDAISFTRGGSDEASVATPGQLTLTVKNNTGKYATTAFSSNYPNVRKNTPIRIRLLYNSSSYTRFVGYVTSFTPTYAQKGNDSRVTIVANGALQRITQSNAMVGSALKRGITSLLGTTTAPVAYWPCEDTITSTLDSFASGIPDAPKMSITAGTQALGSYSGFPCSLPLPVYGGSSWHGRIPTYPLPATNAIQVTFLFQAPGDSGCVPGTCIMQLHCYSPQPIWLLRWGAYGTLTLECWDYNGLLYNSFGPFSLGAIVLPKVIRLKLLQAGPTTVNWGVFVYDIDTNITTSNSGTWIGGASGPIIGQPESVHMFTDGASTSMSAGHIFVQPFNDATATLNSYYQSYIGEDPATRVARLATEEGEFITVTGTSSIDLGPQLPMSYLYLLQESAFTEQGLLADGINQGPTYYVREAATSQNASLVVDADLGQVANILPVDDDKLVCNRFQAQRPGGSSYEVNDITGPFGQTAVGEYVLSGTFNRQYDLQLADCAYWMLNKGTHFAPDNISTVRYPTVPLVLEKTPTLATHVFDTDMLDRIDIINASSVVTQTLIGQTISVAVQGYSESISSTEWHVTYNTSPWDTYRVAVYNDTVDPTYQKWLSTWDTYANGPLPSPWVLTGPSQLTVTSGTVGLPSTGTNGYATYDVGFTPSRLTCTWNFVPGITQTICLINNDEPGFIGYDLGIHCVVTQTNLVLEWRENGGGFNIPYSAGFSPALPVNTVLGLIISANQTTGLVSVTLPDGRFQTFTSFEVTRRMGRKVTVQNIRILTTDPQAVWRTVEADLDLTEYGGRFESDGCQVKTGVSAGATSIAVSIPTGPTWTTAAADLPMTVNILDVPVTVTAIGAASGGANVNTGFESGIAPWGSVGGTISQSSTQVHSGSFSAKNTPDGVTATNWMYSDFILVSPGQVYNVVGWVWFTNTVTNNFTLAVNWFDANYTYITTTGVAGSATAATWTKFDTLHIAPNRAMRGYITPSLGGTPAAGQIWYADDMTFGTGQTFTVTGATVTKSLPAGSPITIWDNPVMEL